MTCLSLGNGFEAMGLSAAIWDGRVWRSIHTVPSVIWFEVEHGAAAERERYNNRLFDQARGSAQPCIGEHAGLKDVFAPIAGERGVSEVLVAGPFATEPPTSAAVLERWRWLTGRQGHPADPEFAHFLEVTLTVLVLRRNELKVFLRFVRSLTREITGRGRGRPAEYDALRTELESTREVERMWDAARSLIDPLTSRSWSSSYRQPSALGIERLPDRALVALLSSREKTVDPLDDALRRESFQRESAGFARSLGNLVAGRVGNRGVVLLSSSAGSKQRKRQRMLELADRLAPLARELGFRLHVGLGAGTDSTLNESYQAALSAAEQALAGGARLIHAEPSARRWRAPVVELDAQLSRLWSLPTEAQAGEAERLLELVAARYGHRVEPLRAYLAATLERHLAGLADSRALDEASHSEHLARLGQAERESHTTGEWLEACRRWLGDLTRALHKPREARRERGMDRALTYIRQHYAEALSLPQVARVAGLAPSYFSALFKRRERITFEHYVRQLRIERAKILLAQHEIEVQQVAHLSGFRERHYFNRAFRKVVGKTPLEYRSTLSGAARTTSRRK